MPRRRPQPSRFHWPKGWVKDWARTWDALAIGFVLGVLVGAVGTAGLLGWITLATQGRP